MDIFPPIAPHRWESHTDSGSQSYNINIRTYLTDLLFFFFLTVNVQNPSNLSFRNPSKATEPWISDCLYQLVGLSCTLILILSSYATSLLLVQQQNFLSPLPQSTALVIKAQQEFKSPREDCWLGQRGLKGVLKCKNKQNCRLSLHCRI